MKQFTIRRTWIPNEESALYDLRIGDDTYRVVETPGYPIALDDTYCFVDEAIPLLDGVQFLDEDAFAEAVADIMEQPSRLSQPISLGAITSIGARNYIKAVIVTELGRQAYDDAVLAENLICLRQLAGKSQSDLADASGVKLSTLQKLESGANRLLGARLEVVLALVRALDVSVDDLIALN